MKKLLFLLAFLSVAVPANAQTPQISVSISSPETIVGQPLSLEVKILVPTWMLKSPVYPSFEVPSLMVRLPEKSTISISERIDGQTWAGVRRTYRLYPLTAGTYRLSPQEFQLTFADPETNAPTEAAFPSPEVVFRAVVPAAARDLDPLIIAESFTIEQSLEGEATLAPGDAVVRKVRATIDGTTVVMIPQLIPEGDVEALRAYVAEPVTTESEGGGSISGTREEQVTYVAQSAGAFSLPPIRLAWLNVLTGDIETIEVPGFNVVVEGEIAVPDSGAANVRLLRVAIILFGAAGLGVLLWKLFRPNILASKERLAGKWEASEMRVHRMVLKALRSRDLNATYTALQEWKDRHGEADESWAGLEDALAAIGRAAHGTTDQAIDDSGRWKQAERSYRRMRSRVRRSGGRNASIQLPPLNPF